MTDLGGKRSITRVQEAAKKDEAEGKKSLGCALQVSEAQVLMVGKVRSDLAIRRHLKLLWLGGCPTAVEVVYRALLSTVCAIFYSRAAEEVMVRD